MGLTSLICYKILYFACCPNWRPPHIKSLPILSNEQAGCIDKLRSSTNRLDCSSELSDPKQCPCCDYVGHHNPMPSSFNKLNIVYGPQCLGISFICSTSSSCCCFLTSQQRALPSTRIPFHCFHPDPLSKLFP